MNQQMLKCGAHLAAWSWKAVFVCNYPPFFHATRGRPKVSLFCWHYWPTPSNKNWPSESSNSWALRTQLHLHVMSEVWTERGLAASKQVNNLFWVVKQLSWTLNGLHHCISSSSWTRFRLCLVREIWEFGYCSIFVFIWQLVFNHGLIRLKTFVSRFPTKLCN